MSDTLTHILAAIPSERRREALLAVGVDPDALAERLAEHLAEHMRRSSEPPLLAAVRLAAERYKASMTHANRAAHVAAWHALVDDRGEVAAFKACQAAGIERPCDLAPVGIEARI